MDCFQKVAMKDGYISYLLAYFYMRDAANACEKYTVMFARNVLHMGSDQRIVMTGGYANYYMKHPIFFLSLNVKFNC